MKTILMARRMFAQAPITRVRIDPTWPDIRSVAGQAVRGLLGLDAVGQPEIDNGLHFLCPTSPRGTAFTQ